MKAKFIPLYILLGIVFIGVAAGIYFLGINSKADYKNILANGKQATATVTDVPDNSYAEYNDEQYFHIEFSFVNDEGAVIHGKTNNAYNLDRLEDMGIVEIAIGGYYFIEGNTIEIMYIGNEAVAKDYIKDPGGVVMWIVAIVFGIVGVMMLVFSVLTFTGVLGGGKIKKNGKSGVGTYLERTAGMMMNDTHYYKIHFTFTNDNGELIEAKTGSSYKEREAEALAGMRTFPIKYSGNKAVIDVDKKTLLEAQQSIAQNRNRG